MKSKFFLQREHNETLAKLNFVLAVSECVLEVATGRTRSECLVLLVRVLQLLSSGLNLATTKLREGTLQPSPSVKNGLFFFYNWMYMSVLIFILLWTAGTWFYYHILITFVINIFSQMHTLTHDWRLARSVLSVVTHKYCVR